MRHTNGYELRTAPVSEWGDTFRHLSYAIFRTDGRFGEIMATHWTDDHYLRAGELIQTALPLTDDEVTYLMQDHCAPAPLFVETDAGLGILSKCYDLQAGLGLYLHVHTRPDAGARLLRMGALGQATGLAFSLSGGIQRGGTPNERLTSKDTESFAALVDAWRMAQTIEHGFLPIREGKAVSLATLRDAIEEMADFAGCTVVFEEERAELLGHRVLCYRPAVLEAMLFYTLTEISNHSTDGRAICHLGRMEGMESDRLSMCLHYEIDREHLSAWVRQGLEQNRRYLIHVAGLSGLSLYFPPLALPKLRLHLYQNPLPNHGVYFEWHEDPFLLPSGDLKAHLTLDRKTDDEEWAAEAYDRSVELAYRERSMSERH